MKKSIKRKMGYILGIVLLVLVVLLCYLIFIKSGDTKQITHKRLRNTTASILFHDPNDVNTFNERLTSLNKEIENNTGSIDFDQIIEKARLLSYLGKPGESIKMYETNYNNTGNATSITYIQNMARLYQSIKAYNLALEKYEYLIEKYGRYDYYKDMSDVWQLKGNEKKSEEYMAKYLSKINPAQTQNK